MLKVGKFLWDLLNWVIPLDWILESFTDLKRWSLIRKSHIWEKNGWNLDWLGKPWRVVVIREGLEPQAELGRLLREWNSTLIGEGLSDVVIPKIWQPPIGKGWSSRIWVVEMGWGDNLNTKGILLGLVWYSFIWSLIFYLLKMFLN